MILKNVTKNEVICKDLKYAQSFLDLLLGLINPKNPRFLLFNTRFGIHTFFLKEAIDVVILDNKKKVVLLRVNLKPNQIFFWNPKHHWIIELPKGTINKTKTEVNDQYALSSSK